MDKLSSNDAAHGSIRDDLRAVDARLAGIKEQEEKARAELAALREGDNESSSGLGELFKERDMLRCARPPSQVLGLWIGLLGCTDQGCSLAWARWWRV